VLCHKNELNVFLGGFIVFVFSYTSLSLQLSQSCHINSLSSDRAVRTGQIQMNERMKKHTMQGHGALTINPVGVRKNAPQGGRSRKWSESFPGNARLL